MSDHGEAPDFFEAEIKRLLAPLNPTLPDSGDEHYSAHYNESMKQAALCSIALSQIQIAGEVQCIASHALQIDSWLQGVNEELDKINSSLEQIDTTLTTQLG